MDRKVTASLFEIAHQLRKRRVFLWFAAIFVLLPTFLTHFFFWRIEHRLKLKIHCKPFVTLLPGTIHLSGPFLEWKNRLYIRSGYLTVHYPLAAIFQNKVSLTLNGHDLAVEAGPEFLHSLGAERVMFDHVAAKLAIGSKHIDIDFLDAESKTIQFHLKKLSQSKNFKKVRN